jgi:hypothetical protein
MIEASGVPRLRDRRWRIHPLYWIDIRGIRVIRG